MNPPEAIVFDLGKVLVDFDYGIAARRIAANSKVPLPEVRARIEHSPLLARYETGRIDSEQFYEEVKNGTGFDGTFEEFSRLFADIFWPIDPMVRLHDSLRRRNLPTFIFSNTNDLAVTHIGRNFPFFSLFTDYILSYEHGAMKPDAALYEVVEATTGQQGDHILYLDDRPENIEAGRERGWRVILQETPEKTLAAMRKLDLT
ncbi:MAG TPA: HAD family phosphatase [Methylomirabilota bacterium]|nr:HAD family phosphatase [Methylomirabilota bacterium]